MSLQKLKLQREVEQQEAKYGQKKHTKKASKVSADKPTVVSGTDVHFDYTDGVSGSEGKKNTSKGKKKLQEKVTEAEIYDSEADYPTSRVIKRAPNGDVIVESLPEADKTVGHVETQKSIPAKLDSHWESLNAEEKKMILRIEKDEVFEVIKNYQSTNNCNCSVCGRRNVAMEQELERIYNTLYENAKQSNSDTDFVLFHLNMIKELQRTNSSSSAQVPPPKSPSPQYLEDMRDEAIKYCLSNKAVESLKEEVLQFKHNKQIQQHQTSNSQEQSRRQGQHEEQRHHIEAHPQVEEPQVQHGHDDEVNQLHQEHLQQPPQPQEEEQIKQPHQHSHPEHLESKQRDSQNLATQETSLTVVSAAPSTEQFQDSVSNQDLKDKYMNFAKTFVSSHPKIAQEYVNRMMMYPDMRALTEDLMNNNGQGFIKAMENFVLQKNEAQIEEVGNEEQLSAALQDGAPLTPEQYADLQRHLAEKMTSSFDVQTREFKNLHEMAGKRLLEQFLAGEDPVSKLMDSFVKQTNEHNEPVITEEPAQQQFEYDDEEDYDEEDYSEYEDEEESEYEDDVYEDDEEDEEDGYHRHYHHHHHHQHQHHHDEDVELGGGEDSTAGNEEEFDSGVDEQERLEEGRRLIQIAITKLLQKKLVDSYHEKQAENNRLRLLQELEVEEQKKKEKEEKKQRKREKEKEKKRLQQLAKEQEKRKREEEEARLTKEAEEREMQRREAQRKKVEETKRKKDEERRRKMEEQRRREEEQQRQRRLKEEQKRKKEEEKRQREEEKRQKDEEFKRLKEQKRLEKEEQILQDEAARVREAEKTRKEEDERTRRRLSTPPDGVPYGTSALSSGPNSNLFHMINEAASKSISSSPSHLQSLLQSQRPQGDSQTFSTGTPLSMGTASVVPPTNGYGHMSFDSLVGHQQPMSSAWDNSNNLYQASPSLDQSYIERQPPQSIPPVANQTYPSLSNAMGTKNSFSEELNNLTNLLSSATLNGGRVPTGADSSFFQDSLWSNVDQTSRANAMNFVPTNSTVAPVANSSGPQRKSIWDSDVSLNSLSTNRDMPNYGSDIWRSANSVPNLPSAAIDKTADSIIHSYVLLSRETAAEFVPVNKLYQTTLTCMPDNPAFSYANFIGSVLSMRSSHNCEVITNPSGTITHARIPYQAINSQQPRYQQRVATNADQLAQDTNGSANTLFKELYNNAPNPVGSSGIPLANPPVANDSSSNIFDFDQQFGQTRTSNIWG